MDVREKSVFVKGVRIKLVGSLLVAASLTLATPGHAKPLGDSNVPDEVTSETTQAETEEAVQDEALFGFSKWGDEAVNRASVGARLVASARSQLGVRQDCTAMVEKALRSVGKRVGDLAPNQFFQFGQRVSQPRPGDLVYYRNGGMGREHIAIYIGNNQAIHGGWNGFTTAVGPLHVGSGPSAFIRVN